MHKRYLKIFVVIFGLVILSNAISTLMYLNNPKIFYFRSWEFFDEVAYNVNEIDASWQGIATSDQTRENYFYYQDSHHLDTSVDGDGYRSQPLQQGEIKILIAGDSTIFGSGLNDDQTFPWVLSNLVNENVFNGGRSALPNTLQKPGLESVNVVIDGVVERVINKDGVFVSYGHQEGDPYQPIMSNDIKQYDLYQHVPPARYLATSMFIRSLGRVKEDLKTWLSGGEKTWLFNNHTMTPTDLEAAVVTIKQRRDFLASKKIRYIFMAVPSKQTIYDENVDTYTRNYIHVLAESLKEEGVEVIDLLTTFDSAKETQQLYRNFDTHWNENGTRVAAEEVAKYLSRTQR